MEIGNEITRVTKLTISRGDNDEVDVDLEKVEDCVVYDEMENEIRFGEIYKNQKTIIVFTRTFSCFTCKEYVDDLAIIPEEYLQEAGVRIVIIGFSYPEIIRSFKKATTFRYSIYVDPDLTLYKMLGFKKKMNEKSQINNSKHVKSTMIGGIIKSTWRVMFDQNFRDDLDQNGGSLIVGPGRTVHYSHVDNHMFDHAPINQLLKAAGVRPVSFPLDPRVQII